MRLFDAILALGSPYATFLLRCSPIPYPWNVMAMETRSPGYTRIVSFGPSSLAANSSCFLNRNGIFVANVSSSNPLYAPHPLLMPPQRRADGLAALGIR
jgi:hypothetical protein